MSTRHRGEEQPNTALLSPKKKTDLFGITLASPKKKRALQKAPHGKTISMGPLKGVIGVEDVQAEEQEAAFMR